MSKSLILPSIIVCAIIIKSLIISPNIAESLMFVAAIASFCYLFFLDYKKEPEINKDIRDEMKKLTSDISTINTFINSQKLSGSMRSLIK